MGTSFLQARYDLIETRVGALVKQFPLREGFLMENRLREAVALLLSLPEVGRTLL